MIKRVSQRLVEFLIEMNVIDDEREARDYYNYGVEITVSSILNIILILVLGMIFNCLKEAAVFLLVFVPIRQFTGGFHASTYFKCNLLFCILFLAVICIYLFTYETIGQIWEMWILIFSEAIFITECPVENKNKILSSHLKSKNKILSSLVSVFYGVIGIILRINNIPLGLIVIYTILLIAVLVIAGKISNNIELNE